jgi:hypothetical protein
MRHDRAQSRIRLCATGAGHREMFMRKVVFAAVSLLALQARIPE